MATNPFAAMKEAIGHSPTAQRVNEALGGAKSPFAFIRSITQEGGEDEARPPLTSAGNDVPYKITPEVRTAITKTATNLGAKPEHLLAAINFETGGTFSPSAKNKASGATGLIQFMERTAKGLGTSTAELAKMSVGEQLKYVEKHFQPFKGKLKTLEDTYMAILWPAAVGKPNDYVLFDNSNPANRAYAQNAGLDFNKDGKITKAEAAKKVVDRAKLAGEGT